MLSISVGFRMQRRKLRSKATVGIAPEGIYARVAAASLTLVDGKTRARAPPRRSVDHPGFLRESRPLTQQTRVELRLTAFVRLLASIVSL
jgi:hypothetical protein